jgi:hypothetical protein
MKMFIKIAKIVKTKCYHENHLFRRELVGHVIDEVVNKEIKTKCSCI